MCLTDIQVTKSQSNMEKSEGKKSFIISCWNFYENGLQT